MSNELSRRQALGVFGAVGATFALAACAGPGSTSGAITATGPSAPLTGTPSGKVSFAHWRAEDKDVFDELAKRWAAEIADVSFTQDITTSNDYNAQGLQKIRGANVGDAFASFRGAQFASMADAGIYTDLSATAAAASYVPSLLTAGTLNKKTLGLPYQVVFPMPVSNLDAFDKANADSAPKDWDSFLGSCEALKTSGYVPMAWPGGDVGNAGQLFNCMVANHAPAEDVCAQIEIGTLKVTDDWFIAMLKQYQELVPYMQDNAPGTAVEAVQNMFVQQQAAMLVTGSYHISAVRALGAEFPVDLTFPSTNAAGKTATYEGVYNATFILGVNAASEVQPAAYSWVEFLSRPENAAYYADNTAQHVAVEGVKYSDPDLVKLSPWLSKKTMLAARFQFENLDVRNAVEATAIAVVGGTSPQEAAESAQLIVDQNLR